MAEPKFKSNADEPMTFCGLSHPDGSTVTAEAGAEFEVGTVHESAAILHELLEPLNAEAKKLIAEAKKALKAGAAEVGQVAEEVVAKVEGTEDPPAS